MSSTPTLLKRLHYLSLVARRLGGSPLLAAPRKKLPGGGTEVTGYRDYASGDDYRQIYWTWCARRDELLVKVFEGDADRHVYLLVDNSPSMGLGRPAKFPLARQIAAALGYVSLLNLDRLGVAAFADGLTADLPPLRHQSRAIRLLRFLDSLAPGGGQTDLLRSAEAFVRRFPRPGPVVVLSDFYDPNGFRRGIDLLRFSGYEPRLVQIYDPTEADPRALGDVELVDVETQTIRRTTVTERAAERYRALVAAFRRSLRDYCGRNGLVCRQFASNTPEDTILAHVLGGRRDASAAEIRPVASTP